MKFNPVVITPDEFIEAARSYKGMRYDGHHAIEGVSADCAGFFVMALRKAGLLPADHTAGMSASEGHGRIKVLADMLRLNFTYIPADLAQPGDMLRFNFDDEEARHLAIMVSKKPQPRGTILHCMNGRVTNMGKVFEQRIDAHMARYLVGAYRLNQWLEPSEQLVN